MTPTLISYKYLRNLGNYENESLEVTAVLEEHETIEKATEDLKNLVKSLLYEGYIKDDLENEDLEDDELEDTEF